MKNKIFIQRLSNLKKISKKSFNQIERELGYPRNTLQSYRKGTEPSVYRAVELASYFEVTVEYLIGYKSNNKPLKSIFEELSHEQREEMFLLCRRWLPTHTHSTIEEKGFTTNRLN